MQLAFGYVLLAFGLTMLGWRIDTWFNGRFKDRR
jgi:hypothetical protein